MFVLLIKRGRDERSGRRVVYICCTEHKPAADLLLECELLVALLAEAFTGGGRSRVHRQEQHHVGCYQPSVRRLAQQQAAVC